MLRKFAALLVSAALAMPAVAAPPAGVMVASQMADHAVPRLNSHSVLVLNGNTGEPLYEKNIHQRMPIASITKLMTAMVLLDSGVSLDQEVSVSDAEIDRLKNTTSRLAVGTTLPRKEMLLLALMSSENRAAATLARTALPEALLPSSNA
jgi:D-alanyl-D-alanine endopeptidase (penicillin-binding protein 7)